MGFSGGMQARMMRARNRGYPSWLNAIDEPNRYYEGLPVIMYIVPTDPVPYALFIARHLMMPVNPANPEQRAAAETELAMLGDRWFWADDNAKILNFLAVPELLPRFTREVEEAFQFLASLCHGPFVLRRKGHPRLEKIEEVDGRAHFTLTFLDIRCDLPKGIVSIGMRFHDGRDARNLILTGNYVSFTYKGQRHLLDVEDAIARWDISWDGPDLKLRHASDMVFDVSGRRQRLGTLWYEYCFAATRTSCDVHVRLELDPATEVSDVILSVGHDDLSHGANNVNYGVFRGDQADEPPLVIERDERLARYWPVKPLAYWSIGQLEYLAGFALGVHNLPADPDRIVGVRLERMAPERFRWLVIEHAFPGIHCGGTLVVEERKWIASGGLYDRTRDYLHLLQDPGVAESPVPVDLSISYDYGAELEAFARGIKTAAIDGMTTYSAPWRDRVRDLYDAYLEVYRSSFLEPLEANPNVGYSRPLSCVALSLCDMIEATGDQRYLERLGEVVNALLAFRRDQTDVANNPCSVYPAGRVHDSWPYVDCQSAALCALARAYPFLEDERIPAAIDAGLGAYVLATVPIDSLRTLTHDGVGVDAVGSDGKRRVLDTYWNFTVGLALRAFKEISHSSSPAIRSIAERHRPRLRLFNLLLRHQVRRSLRPRGDALEVRTCVFAAEGNSETQPWVALGVTDVLERANATGKMRP